MFPTKWKGQHDRIDRAVISCFCRNLLFMIVFVIKTSISKPPHLLCFLCLINSFERRYVSSRSNRSTRSNTLNHYPALLDPGNYSFNKNVLNYWILLKYWIIEVAISIIQPNYWIRYFNNSELLKYYWITFQ